MCTTAPSPFRLDNTASNMGRCTLMNYQVGVVMAACCDTKPNVRVTALPSMIRVDSIGPFDVVYDDVFDAAEFEENISTHYGRMIHRDERTIMVARPEDTAEYLNFDLTRVSA